MEGKFKHNKNGKFESRYSEEFKRKVIEEYLETGTPKQHLLDKYGIPALTRICSAAPRYRGCSLVRIYDPDRATQAVNRPRHPSAPTAIR
jgi:hypothetical protein